jgi:Tol biopolymer transport system component
MARGQSRADVVFLDIAPAPNSSLLTTSASIPAAQFAVSPDGRFIAFVATAQNGQPALWLRELASGVTRRLPDTEGASYPFWSPDSANIGFFSRGQLVRTTLTGNAPVRICQAIDPRGGTWNGDNVVLFALSRGAVFRVPASGGNPAAVTALDGARQEVTHRWPSFLPDGKRFIFVARGGQASLKIASLDGRAQVITTSMYSATVAPPGHLLFERDGALLVQPLDRDLRQLTGAPAVIAPMVGTSSVGHLAVSASSAGLLVFASDLSSPGQLTWFDRQGRVTGRVGPVADNMDFESSPDDGRVLVSRVEPRTSTANVWLVDLARGTEERLTTGSTVEAAALWDPSAMRVAFRSNRSGVAHTYMKQVGGSSPEELIFSGVSTNPTSWSRNGEYILYNESNAETGWDVRQFSFATKQTTSFIETAANELHGRFSPDGEWGAYSSDESGKWEVYVRRTDGRGERVLISTSGGFEPRWRGDGREIFYVTADRRIMAVAVTSGASLRTSPPQTILTAQIEPLPAALTVSSSYRRTYTVSGMVSGFSSTCWRGNRTRRR